MDVSCASLNVKKMWHNQVKGIHNNIG